MKPVLQLGATLLVLATAIVAVRWIMPAPPPTPAQSNQSALIDRSVARESLAPLAKAILDASVGAQVICLGETHGSVADAELRSELLRQPSFPKQIDVILFEAASGTHQRLIDEFVLEGSDLSRSELEPVWQDAGRGVMWQLPMYERFLREVRELNLRLPAEERIPLLGAAVPIPWNEMLTAADLAPWLDRKRHLRRLIEEQVLAPGRRALMVFGKLHCEKRQYESGREGESQIVGLISQQPPSAVWSAFSFTGTQAARRARARLGLGPDPQLVRINGTPLAAWRAEDAFFEVHQYNGALLDDVLDAAISYGVQDRPILRVDEDALSPRFVTELRRRDRLRSEAIRVRATEH